MNSITPVYLVLLPAIISFVSSEQYHIVTSYDSTCPSEHLGESCLTLTQYVSSPSRSSNITLIMESGYHSLQDKTLLFNSNIGSNVFVMIAETLQMSPAITAAQHFQITGVRFTGNNGQITVYGAQNLAVVLSDCSFHGVRLYLRKVTSATITRCNFSHNSNHYYTNNIIYIERAAALTVSSSTLLLLQCNFRDNDLAVDFYTHDEVMHSLHVRECAFVNNTSKYYYREAGALRFLMHLYYGFGSPRYQYGGVRLLSVTDCTFINNAVEHKGGAVKIDILSSYIYYNYNRDFLQFSIMDSIFINNTSRDRGGAVYISNDAESKYVPISVFVQRNVFINNTAYSTSGGAIHFNGRHSNISLVSNSFMHNSADTCGALNIQSDYNNVIEIINSSFYHNNVEGTINIGGGAVCFYNALALISNCTFVDNSAKVDGGAIVSHYSDITIEETLFNSNSAGRDGGALATSIFPSNSTIFNSRFEYNEAGDDGGALFIGRRESYMRVDGCAFSSNHATDRGGAIAIFGSTIDLTGTIIDNNAAGIGENISSCNSNVTASNTVTYQEGNVECPTPDANGNHFNSTPILQEQNYCTRNVTLNLLIEKGNLPTIGRLHRNKLSEINAVTYTSLTLSIILVVSLMLYIINSFRGKCNRNELTEPAAAESEPIYEEAYERATDNTIKMKPNMVYGRHELQEQTKSRITKLVANRI